MVQAGEILAIMGPSGAGACRLLATPFCPPCMRSRLWSETTVLSGEPLHSFSDLRVQSTRPASLLQRVAMTDPVTREQRPGSLTRRIAICCREE